MPRKNAEVEAFWAQTEEELGERIIIYSMAQYVDGREEAGPLWGLLYLSETALHFRYFSHENWLGRFMKSAVRSGSGTGAKKEREVVFRIDLRESSELRKPPPQGWLQRIFASRPPLLALESRGNADPFRFTIEYRAEEFIVALERQLALINRHDAEGGES
jgi:hypothetical protein